MSQNRGVVNSRMTNFAPGLSTRRTYRGASSSNVVRTYARFSAPPSAARSARRTSSVSTIRERSSDGGGAASAALARWWEARYFSRRATTLASRSAAPAFPNAPRPRSRQSSRRRRRRPRPRGARGRTSRAAQAVRAARVLARVPHGARPRARGRPHAGHVREGALAPRSLPGGLQVLVLALQDRQQRRHRSPQAPSARHREHRRLAARDDVRRGRGIALRDRGHRLVGARRDGGKGAGLRHRARNRPAAPRVSRLHHAPPRRRPLLRGARDYPRPAARHREDLYPPRTTRAAACAGALPGMSVRHPLTLGPGLKPRTPAARRLGQEAT